LGGEGSTHVLATAIHAARLGAHTHALRWRHEMNPTADRVAALALAQCESAPVYATSIGAMIQAAFYRLRNRNTTLHYIPLGGSVPLGVLAHVNAALELALQINAGILPRPARLVVPLGSGGTAAGLLLGFAFARLNIDVIGVQVTPRIVANHPHVMRLASRTATLIERITGEPFPRAEGKQLRVVRNVYGGAYGRMVPAACDAADWLARANGMSLDYTYSAKAFACALAYARAASKHTQPTLFWNTFDGRILH
jgi:D-cysteine desulfhydrase